MIGFIDKKIEGILKRALHKKRDTILQKALKDYINKHHPDEDTIAELTKKLEDDIDRIFTLADRSLIHANMLRARYVFWITAIIGTVIAVGLAAYPVTTSIVPFFVPLMAAFVGWAVSVGTIPVGYIHTAIGVMDASIAIFEKEQMELEANPEYQHTQTSIADLQKMAEDLQRKIQEYSVHAGHKNSSISSDFDASATPVSNIGLWSARKQHTEKDYPLDERSGIKQKP